MTRLHQLIVILTILSACYAPELSDCTVTCSGPADCGGGQVCGTDGYCAAGGVAGTCGPDAGVMTVMLHIQVMGNGKVNIAGGGTCSTDCMVSVPKGMVALSATAVDTDKPFDRWTTPPCAGQTSACTFTATTATTVGAKFH